MMMFVKYLCRWQASTFILAPVMWMMSEYNSWVVAGIANLIGGCIFYRIDRWILCREKK